MRPHQAFAFTFVLSFMLCLPIIGAMSPAFAATVDFAPIALRGIDAAALILTAIGGVLSKFVISFVASKTKVHNVQLEMMMAEKVNLGLQNAINFASTRAKQFVADPTNKKFTTVEFDNWFVSQGVQYFLDHYAESTAFFKLNPASIADMLRSRMAPYLGNPVPNSGVLQTADVAVTVEPPLAVGPGA
jgi:hypothetical protein